MKVVFFGTPPFAANVLTYLIDHSIEVTAIVTKPDKPQGRSGKPAFSAVKEVALKKYPSIPLYQPEEASDPAFAKRLRSYNADLFIVVAYGEIMKENLLRMPRLRCINVHSSLLPKYRGAAPMQFALLNGDTESGVTIMEMALKMDAGDIISQKIVPIPADMNLEQLESALCQAGCEALLEVIDAFEKGTIVKTPQDHGQATYVKKIDPSMAEMNWTEAATVLHNRIRAFSPKPGAWCIVEINGQPKRLKILRSRVSKNHQGFPGETVQYDKTNWVLACGSDALELLEVQLEGKKRMAIEDFLRGYPNPPQIRK
ncbi:methionyl-tRNA formyltransferase [Simkania negevensis]|uniref:Methionyl-tRNA formyltransferase n=1 Tax=Simkania negevensis (strain ATCC VR-1471 / DSM 27360 / Z) TaxID=331113 RepID=F8L3Y5_SIMNZ|nr:methionyl-tRNA formyltransferase [Simkania negevensis]CCB90015.1 methionyl-tRNA formyltransferase [Simkania negevensis Z]